MRLFRFLVPVFLVLAVLCPDARAERVYIQIQDPFLRTIPLALPGFAAGADPRAAEAAREGRGILEEVLAVPRFFQILPEETYITDLAQGASARDLDFKDWTAIGAELLITGSVDVEGDILALELRLFDTYTQRLLAGKRYKAHRTDLRRIILRFASEVVQALTGTPGVFDTRIAFVSTATGNKEIFVSDFDGHNPVAVTHDSVIALSPAWSADGRFMAWSSYKERGPNIHVLDTRTRQGTVIKYTGLNVTPAWSPKGFVLAACLSKDGNPEIYSLTGTGKVINRLTDNWGIDVSPSWFPDGKKIAFVSNRSGGPQIYELELATGEVRRLTFSGKDINAPAVSPNGEYIAYQGIEDRDFDIFVMRSDGSKPVRLTSGAGNNESPSWSPDGTLIAFSSTREGPSRIYVMTARGTQQRRLLIQAGEQSEPAWSPNLPDF
ncbi:MAG: Tol-Pal system beta propeller repeat protein TolB [Proteobacteria bacterium]|nr:Tol-Pal system beta propeller repeat protein TolB [Pseudomonadota bacterium]